MLGHSLDNYLNFHIDKLTMDQDIPIDVFRVANRIGAVIEEREMIPEAAMEVKEGQFHIYLRSNFRGLPGTALRARFSLAHEIGHTLFYEQRDGSWKSRKDAPRGDRLEAACHKAAAMILVPSTALSAELHRGAISNAASLTELADRFEVSVEVMVRRLHDFGGLNGDWAPVLTRRNGNDFEIEYAVYPPWLKSHLGEPARGADFLSWMRPTHHSGEILGRTLPGGQLEAEPFNSNGSKTIFELRFRSS
jgi:Zn-dependent peptidase ImmA (M78 family)